MSDFELLSVIIGFLTIIVMLIIALFNAQK